MVLVGLYRNVRRALLEVDVYRTGQLFCHQVPGTGLRCLRARDADRNDRLRSRKIRTGEGRVSSMSEMQDYAGLASAAQTQTFRRPIFGLEASRLMEPERPRRIAAKITELPEGGDRPMTDPEKIAFLGGKTQALLGFAIAEL